MISDELRAHIEASGQTAYAIALEAQIDPGIIQRFLNGTRGLSLDSVDRIAEALDLRLFKPREKGQSSARRPIRDDNPGDEARPETSANGPLVNLGIPDEIEVESILRNPKVADEIGAECTYTKRYFPDEIPDLKKPEIPDLGPMAEVELLPVVVPEVEQTPPPAGKNPVLAKLFGGKRSSIKG
jgi:hypothetical protein